MAPMIRMGKGNDTDVPFMQVECIVAALPQPSENDIKAVGCGFGTCLLNQYDKLNESPNPKLDDLLKDSPSDAKNLIKSLIVLNPNKRLTAKQALYHKYVEKYVHRMCSAQAYRVIHLSRFLFQISQCHSRAGVDHRHCATISG